TPRINKGGGRDHYGELTPLLLSGGGLAMGKIVGQSDAHATRPATTPYRPEHLLATIMHVLFDVGQLRLVRGLPDGLVRAATENEPIAELL
ncbi:MAG: DUF1501 domain-containing protein, partial [Planctomycetia bacterium]|nr:DUF1501 domain-containing protein [Planctomycetia bacterium]